MTDLVFGIFDKSIQIAASSSEELIYAGWDEAHVKTGYRASIKAYKEAGIKNPRKDMSMAEVYDCFSITEAVTMEALPMIIISGCIIRE